jgi:hypothetical protein
MFSHWRQHALGPGLRDLDQLRAMPDSAWRLNHIARRAERAAVDARTANEVLEHAGVAERLHEESFRSLATVADAVRSLSSLRAG